jgi:hypothetical protein
VRTEEPSRPSITHSLLVQTRNQHDLVDCVDNNHVIGYLDAQSITMWKIFKLEYWSYTFELADFFKENNRVLRKVRPLGGENGQFRHNRASNVELGMKILQKEITGTQTSFSTSSGGKLSFILCFLFPERLHCCYIYFHCSYLYNYYNYSPTLSIKC